MPNFIWTMSNKSKKDDSSAHLGVVANKAEMSATIVDVPVLIKSEPLPLSNVQVLIINLLTNYVCDKGMNAVRNVCQRFLGLKNNRLIYDRENNFVEQRTIHVDPATELPFRTVVQFDDNLSWVVEKSNMFDQNIKSVHLSKLSPKSKIPDRVKLIEGPKLKGKVLFDREVPNENLINVQPIQTFPRHKLIANRIVEHGTGDLSSKIAGGLMANAVINKRQEGSKQTMLRVGASEDRGVYCVARRHNFGSISIGLLPDVAVNDSSCSPITGEPDRLLFHKGLSPTTPNPPPLCVVNCSATGVICSFLLLPIVFVTVKFAVIRGNYQYDELRVMTPRQRFEFFFNPIHWF